MTNKINTDVDTTALIGKWARIPETASAQDILDMAQVMFPAVELENNFKVLEEGSEGNGYWHILGFCADLNLVVCTCSPSCYEFTQELQWGTSPINTLADLTKITTPFGELDIDTQLALVKAYIEEVQLENMNDRFGWRDKNKLSQGTVVVNFYVGEVYRVKGNSAEVDSINKQISYLQDKLKELEDE